jgi:hypothetical protein
LEFAAQKPLSLVDLPVALVTLVVFFVLGYGLSRASRGVRLVIAGLLLIWFMSSGTTLMYGITLRSIREASLLLIPLGLLLLRSLIRMNVVPPVEHIRTFALLAIFAFAALIQFPYAGLIYFLYVAPLMFLAALALLGQWRDGGRPVLSPLAVAALFLFVAVFGVARLNQLSSGAAATIGEGAALPVERSGGLIVSPHDSELYRRLVMVIQARAVGRYIYAGPDAPEVYFLADRRNPTRWQFEFLERGSAQDRQLLQALRSHEVSLVVLNHRPSFSPPWDSDVRTALARRYPFHEQIGRFEVRWRA